MHAQWTFPFSRALPQMHVPTFAHIHRSIRAYLYSSSSRAWSVPGMRKSRERQRKALRLFSALSQEFAITCSDDGPHPTLPTAAMSLGGEGGQVGKAGGGGGVHGQMCACVVHCSLPTIAGGPSSARGCSNSWWRPPAQQPTVETRDTGVTVSG